MKKNLYNALVKHVSYQLRLYSNLISISFDFFENEDLTKIEQEIINLIKDNFDLECLVTYGKIGWRFYLYSDHGNLDS